MKANLKVLTIGLFAVIPPFAHAQKIGTLSIFMLKDGKPLIRNEIVVDNKKHLRTDIDGRAKVTLKIGKHQIEAFGKNSKGSNLGYIKKSVLIKEDKDTQVIASFTMDEPEVNVDIPVGEVEKKKKKDSKATGEGTLNGTVLTTDKNSPIEGARVFVKGTSIDARTDANGHFSVKIPSGVPVSISVVSSAYSAQTISDLKVEKGGIISKTIKLTPASLELEEFVVLAPKIEGSVATVIAEVKNNEAVGDVLGSEQFSKSGDSSAAAALKRVSGVTIVGGKYVFVRGLGDRYSTVMFNGMHLPSPEPSKRVVPLDIFPTSVIKSMTIQKAFTGDIPGSFGGGTVLIDSKDIPKKPFAKVSLGLTGNSAVGSNGVYNGDNSKSLPSSVISASNGFEYINDEAFTRAVLYNRSMHRTTTTIPVGGSIGLALGDSYEIGDDMRLGASATMFYKNSADNNDLEYQKHIYNMNTKSIFTDSKTNAEQTKFKTQYGGMFNLGLNYLGDSMVKYTYFMIDDITDTSTFANINYSGEDEDRDKSYFEYVDKKLDTHQLTGQNFVHFKKGKDGYFDDLKIDWGIEHATATRDEPGTVETNYLHQTSGVNWDQKNWYYYFMLDDKVDNYKVDFTLPYKYNGRDNYTKMGVFVYKKSRDFDSRRFKLSDKASSGTGIDLSQDMNYIYSHATDGDLEFESAYRASDSYSASQDVNAFYLQQLVSVTPDFDMVASARYESSKQGLTDAQTGKPYDPLKTNDVLPGLSMTYRFADDKMQLRSSLAKTLTRPDFREFSPNRYKDPITENIVFGNPDLKATAITHADIKYEWYPSSDEMFSFAVFTKSFENPIETVVRKNDAQGNEMEQSYTNAKSASSYGIELDLRKRFGFLGDGWENMLFATNFAWINSKVKIDRNSYPYFTERLTTTDRAMQGQSPYVMNYTLGYDNPETGDSAYLLYNEIGKNIASLGTDNNKDIYQQPFKKLDLSTKWKLSDDDDKLQYFIGFKAENILDSTMKFTQGDLTTQSFKPGRSFSIKLDIKY
jgi:TonB-dependent receptor